MAIANKAKSSFLQKKTFYGIYDEFGLDNSQLSPPVGDLMEHIWKEATGELEDEISIPLQSIKLEQVFYAFFHILRIKRKVASRQTNPTFTVSISVRNEFIH
jgi:hypothetical protein